MADYDIAVIGGGINGAGIARDAAGRGLAVLLLEQNDLASGASSASAKLVEGGLDDLRGHAFGPLRAALGEREVLLRGAPHLVRPIRLVLLPQDGDRPAWLQRAELLLYDHLGRRRLLPRSQTVDLTHHLCGAPLRRRFAFGFAYSDCRVDDARLVILNAVDAALRGAAVRTRTRCIRAERAAEWTLVLNARGRRAVVTARAVVDATGPWQSTVGETVFRRAARASGRLRKRSHIVVPALFDHDHGYALPAPDGRIVFALPFEGMTLVGPAETEASGDPATLVPGPGEIAGLCEVINRHFRRNVAATDVVWAFAGAGCGSGAERAEEEGDGLALDAAGGLAPLLTVGGRRLTTHRRLAEAALDRLADFFAGRPSWTRHAPLPGGEFGPGGFAALLADVRRRWPFLAEPHAHRLVCAYGGRVDRVLGDATGPSDLGVCFGADLTAAEVRYMMRHEWAETPDDVLWRRSRLGLAIGAEGRELIARFMTAELGSART